MARQNKAAHGHLARGVYLPTAACTDRVATYDRRTLQTQVARSALYREASGEVRV
jgi:hypothetical protein